MHSLYHLMVGLKAFLSTEASARVSWVMKCLTIGSLEDIKVAAFAHCGFLYLVEGKGSCRQPQDFGRYRRLVLACLARPVQCLRNLTAMGFFSTQEMG